ncbi:MAG TPA: ClpX C4-type zinc finger protein [Vicinamibacterales bacterium]|nr:ClpX C4-type zinc finger protein [Vicinamibacterales bacterium]
MFRLLFCSFCRRRETEVAKLVAGPRLLFIGPRVYICDDCAALAQKIMEGASPAPRHV